MLPSLIFTLLLLLIKNMPIILSVQLRRVWMQDHCQNGICTGIHIGRNDYVIMSQAPITKQLMLTFLNSSIAKIPHLMFDTFPDLQVLHMENCSIEIFEKPQFEGASNLMSLYLGYNLLKDIPKNIFLGADNLNTLMLNDNQLRTLHNASFHSLKELKELSLEGNKLEILPLAVFANIRKLIDLNLARNHLQQFPRGIFDKNLNLTRINLAQNHFTTFESELFKMQPKLTVLDLSGNILQELTLNFIQLDTILANNCDLRKLTVYGLIKELELRNNSLTEIPHIPNTSNVTSLDLSHNPLGGGGSLNGNPLKRFTGLLRLNFSSCNLHNLPEGIWKKQTNLKLLDISANSLYNMKFIMLDSLKSLQYFYFQQNNWNCDFLQLLMNSFVKPRDISFMEDNLAPEFVDDYIDGIACWYENNMNSKHCSGGDGGGGLADASLELAIVRNDIKNMMDTMDKKFIKIYRLLEEMKLRL